MKLNLSSTLININTKDIDKFSVIAKKGKNKITYQTDEYSYIIKILSSNNIVMNRNNKEIDITLYFELNKKTKSIYILKKEGYTIEIELKTTNIKIEDNKIDIYYEVIDSNDKYEYIIEMSE